MSYLITDKDLSTLEQIFRGLDESLQRVTSGNLSHRIANIRSYCSYGNSLLKDIKSHETDK